MIETSTQLPDLKLLAEAATSTSVAFLLVDNCAAWAADHGCPVSSDPNAMAVRRRSDGQPTVILRSAYTADHIERVSGSLWAAGWPDQSEEVKEPAACLRFLVLHELAHLVNDWGQEREQDCNEWAFRRLGWVSQSARTNNTAR